MMLDDLKNVDWTALGESEMPEWLMAVTSDNHPARQEALNRLTWRLTPWPAYDYVDGTPDQFKEPLRDDIPLATVPFLIELLSDEQVGCKEFLLEVLYDLACYIYAAEVYIRDSDTEDQIYRTRARLIREAVRKGRPIYESFLDLPESYIDSKEMRIKESAKAILSILRVNKISDL